ncbi:MAG: NYN domain-containing protein [Phormidium sp.]
MKLPISIYVDSQNVYLSEDLGILLLAFAKSIGRLIDAKVYYNSLCLNQASAMDKLKNFGFKYIDVPCPLKNSADNQLIADCIKDAKDIVILVSGDGDFADLVITLQKLDKKVIVFANQGNVKQRMIELADEFHFLNKLPELVGEKSQTKTTISVSDIGYNEAINYLLEAIKTALSKGKRARCSLIDSLMRQLFPEYQGVKFIRTPDGKKFSKFIKFVEAVAKDGKVRMENQELFLIEQYKAVV